MADIPKLYNELADWWQLILPTSDYADEGEFFTSIFKHAGAKSILELGAGGGNVAWYLKLSFEMTLTDLSPGMLESSRQQNPECEHVLGDMRTLRLERKFDAVLIHDAIMYMLSEDELRKVFETAVEHLKPGGMLVVAPDCTAENFKVSTELEGHDADDGRSVRYLQWVSDPDPNDSVFNYDFIIAMKQGEELRTVVDRQMCGVFPRRLWLDLLAQAGFDARAIPDSSTAGETSERTEVFVAKLKSRRA